MTNISLSLAMGDYDRTRPIVDGRVKIDGVDPTCMLLSPEEMFFRAFRHNAFDISELSLSSYSISVARGNRITSRFRFSCRGRSATPQSTFVMTWAYASRRTSKGDASVLPNINFPPTFGFVVSWKMSIR